MSKLKISFNYSTIQLHMMSSMDNPRNSFISWYTSSTRYRGIAGIGGIGGRRGIVDIRDIEILEIVEILEIYVCKVDRGDE